MQNKDRYHLAIDSMRVIAILAVICIHTTTRILEASSFNIQGSLVAFILNQISRFAVPMFFMISGFVLEVNYPFHQNYLSYFKKRLSRIFLPYLFWSAIYYFLIYTKHSDSFFKALLTGSASYQLYFIPTLLLFYTLFPFVHKLYIFILNRFVLILLGFLQILLLRADYYFHSITIFYPLAIMFFNYYVFILGMVAARNHEVLLKYASKFKWILISLLGILALFITWEGGSLYLKTHNYLYFYSQWRPSVLIYTLITFATLYAFFDKSRKFEAQIRLLSRLSFLVFFIHIIILERFWALVGQDLFYRTSSFPGQQFWFNPLFFVSVAGISYIVAYLVQKIPLVSKLTG